MTIVHNTEIKNSELDVSAIFVVKTVAFPIKVTNAKDVISADMLIRFDNRHLKMKRLNTTKETDRFMVAATEMYQNQETERPLKPNKTDLSRRDISQKINSQLNVSEPLE